MFSDFLGVFNEENPNGIVQTQVNKRFNLNTNRRDVPGSWIARLFGFPLLLTTGWGYFEYFDVNFQLSKIEENRKFLLPEMITISNETGDMEETSFFSPIALYQHRNFSVGGMFNLFNFENQDTKMNIFLDAGIDFGRSGIKANEQADGEMINTFEVPIEAKIHFIPEKRYGFIASNRFIWYTILSSEIENLKSLENGKLVDKKNWLNNIELMAYVNTSKTGKLFIRYNYIHELENINYGFSRFQFGYSFYILGRNGVNQN